jgi:ketosteroid isomerase-like protein
MIKLFTLAGIQVLFFISVNKLYAQQFSTIDIVSVKAIYEKEAMFFYNENWKSFRAEAYRKGFISGYEILKTEKDSTQKFQLILVTKYSDSLSFHNKENNFALIMKSISPNGPKMLNNIPRKDILEYLSGYDAILVEKNFLYENEDEIIKKEIEKVHNEYVSGWLNWDESKLMGLLDENASIQPNQLKPIVGKENIKKFWFPDDNSETKINSFRTKIINFSTVDNLAITTHTSFLDFTYNNGNITINSKQKAVNTTVYRKQQDNTWKIWKSMWADYVIERY